MKLKIKTKFEYSFDDEINFIIFEKKDDNKLYFKAEYNDNPIEIRFSSLENKKQCKLDTIMKKIEKEFLIYSYDDIMDFCYLKKFR